MFGSANQGLSQANENNKTLNAEMEQLARVAGQVYERSLHGLATLNLKSSNVVAIPLSYWSGCGIPTIALQALIDILHYGVQESCFLRDPCTERTCNAPRMYVRLRLRLWYRTNFLRKCSCHVVLDDGHDVVL